MKKSKLHSLPVSPQISFPSRLFGINLLLNSQRALHLGTVVGTDVKVSVLFLNCAMKIKANLLCDKNSKLLLELVVLI